jgi:hypothetical protein
MGPFLASTAIFSRGWPDPEEKGVLEHRTRDPVTLQQWGKAKGAGGLDPKL